MTQEHMDFTHEENNWLTDFLKEAGNTMSNTLAELGKEIEENALITKEAAEDALKNVADDFNYISDLAKKYALKADEYGMEANRRMQDLLDKKALELKEIATHLLDVRYADELTAAVKANSKYLDGAFKRIAGEAGGLVLDAAFVLKDLLDNNLKEVAGDFGGILGGILGYGVVIAMGLNPVGASAIFIMAFGGMLLGEGAKGIYDESVSIATDFFVWLDPLGLINPDVNTEYLGSKHYIAPTPCDPFTLDLDGDGIETSAVAGWNGLKFDHDADGIKEGTGWVSSDDGLLVLDRNSNGAIDSGRELFGDNTLLSNGELAEVVLP